MKSIRNFNNQKITNTHLAITKGGGILTNQSSGGSTDVLIGKSLFTNRFDGSIGNNDKITF